MTTPSLWSRRSEHLRNGFSLGNDRQGGRKPGVNRKKTAIEVESCTKDFRENKNMV